MSDVLKILKQHLQTKNPLDLSIDTAFVTFNYKYDYCNDERLFDGVSFVTTTMEET